VILNDIITSYPEIGTEIIDMSIEILKKNHSYGNRYYLLEKVTNDINSKRIVSLAFLSFLLPYIYKNSA